MSQKLFHIPSLLTAEELNEIDKLIAKSEFIDGKLTASLAAKDVKNNLQLAPGNESIENIHEIINNALKQSPLFNIAALPKDVFPFIVSKYTPGKYYGWHVDSPIMGNPPIRTDLAMTVFLSEPDTYEGGELVIQSDSTVTSFKPAKGDAVLYPCQYLHCVNEIKRGERLAAVTWIQSNVKDADQRQILFQLNQVHSALYQEAPNAPATNLLLQTHSNLFRMWAEI
ncbi:MAG: Fe2+-dependent dioxygenase [Saprospiraceae bacterium]|nr:Fe2+-dependent dioxygenase [Candidatus Brachybacter algidus]MBL0118205.1 Fe2+-dependent dioxygenase [Candidatus Brachybacter algidus]